MRIAKFDKELFIIAVSALSGYKQILPSMGNRKALILCAYKGRVKKSTTTCPYWLKLGLLLEGTKLAHVELKQDVLRLQQLVAGKV